MCTEVFLFFRREEICHIVNVVCVSLHVCKTKTKAKRLFFLSVPFLSSNDLKHLFSPLPFQCILSYMLSVAEALLQWRSC